MARKVIPSPVGPLEISVDASGLNSILWQKRNSAASADANDSYSERESEILRQVETELSEYFSLHRRSFSLPLRPKGSEFQRRVWNELSKIHFGETVSYSEIACRIGKPDAVRAVGGAIGRNPISIVVPCHRVIGKSGRLTGFSGGLENKSALLRLEGHPVD